MEFDAHGAALSLDPRERSCRAGDNRNSGRGDGEGDWSLSEHPDSCAGNPRPTPRPADSHPDPSPLGPLRVVWNETAGLVGSLRALWRRLRVRLQAAGLNLRILLVGAVVILAGLYFLPPLLHHRPRPTTSSGADPVSVVIEAARPPFDRARFQDAFRTLQRSASTSNPGRPIDRSQARSLNDEGLRASRNRSYVEAARLFARAAAIDPGDPEISNNWAFAEIRAGNPQRASEILRSTLLLSPARHYAWINLGEACVLLGRRQDATACFTAGIEAAVDRETALSALAKIGQKATTSDEERSAIREALASVR